MTVLINPGGKYVILDDPKQVEHWLRRPGFKKLNPKDEKAYLKERQITINKRKSSKKTPEIYLNTVSSGGKDGYGIAAEMISKELDTLGLKVKRYYDGQDVAILFHNPYGIARVEAPYRIIYTMFESTKIPDDWIPYLEAANEVWVPSKWVASIFKKAGITAKVIPLGYDANTYKYIKRYNKQKKRQDFNFLHYNAFNARKGFLEVFKAFTQEFKKDEPVKLTLKTTINRSPLPITKSQYPNINVIHGKVSEKKLLDIIHDSDCFVFPSRGEGFGITPLEAMATGIPAIVPNAHGISEYFNSDYMYEVKVKEMTPALYSRYKNQDVGDMFLNDIKHLQKQMRYAYEHQDEVLAKGERAAEYVKKWTFKKTAEIIKKEYDRIMSKPMPKTKITNVLPLEVVR